MSRLTMKDLKEELRIVRQRVLTLEQKLNNVPYEKPEKRKCPCCGSLVKSKYNPYPDKVMW